MTLRSVPAADTGMLRGSVDATVELQSKYANSSQSSQADGMDATSHRIIEKRRRDRMNNCLADLSRLVPSCHQRKGRGRIEKTEIVELAIKHIRHLQSHTCPRPDGSDVETPSSRAAAISNRYEEGYRECLRETMQWMVEHEGFIPGDPLCVRLMNHLHEHMALVLRGGFPPRPHPSSCVSSLSGSTSGYNGNVSSNGSSSDGNGGSTQWPSPCTPPELPYAPTDMAQTALQRPPSSARAAAAAASAAAAGAALQYRADEADQDSDQTHLYKLLQENSDVNRAHQASSSSSRSSEECAGFMYKFKTNMKKRFSADMADSFGSKRFRHGAPPPRSPPPAVADDRKPPLVALLGANAELGRRWRRPTAPTPSQRVPVFALHSKGALYLPMTVDVSAFGSQAELLTIEPLSLLHPINISVCFCERRPPTAAGQPSTSGVSSLPTETVTSDELNSAD